MFLIAISQKILEMATTAKNPLFFQKMYGFKILLSKTLQLS